MKIKTLAWILPLMYMAWAPVASAETGTDDVLGHWLTPNKTVKLEIVKEDGVYSGKIVWMKNPNYAEGDDEAGKPVHDRNNPEEDLRSRPLVGLNLIEGFTFDGEETWSGGTIYDPESGKTYKCRMTMPDKDTLNVRGYIGVPAFGRTEVWTRAPKDHPEETAEDEAEAPKTE